jgi:hypothetical protein
MKRRHIDAAVFSAVIIGVAGLAALVIKSPSQPASTSWTAEAAAIVQEEAPANLVELRFTGRGNTQLCLLERKDGQKAQIYLDNSASGDPLLFTAGKTGATWTVSDFLDRSRPGAIAADDFHQLVHDCLSQSDEAFERQSEARQKENEASWARAAQDRAEGHPHRLETAQTSPLSASDLNTALSNTMAVVATRLLDVNRKMAGITDQTADSAAHRNTHEGALKDDEDDSSTAPDASN